MSQPQDAQQRDEDVVAEIPPGQERPGSVQGGGSEIMQDDAGAGAEAGTATPAGTLTDLDVEVGQEDKGATGE